LEISDSKIAVQYKYWRGEIDAVWKIVEVNKRTLKVETLEHKRK